MNEKDNQRLGELLIELSNGDSSALDGISRLLERILFAIGNAYFRNQADVEDSIHDLYMMLYAKARRFKNNHNACAWIVTIYRNLIKSRLRKWKREEEFFRENRDEIFGRSLMDEKCIENHIYLKQIFGALTKLEQDLIIYYHWCKCSADEVAEIFHIARSTVYKKLSKLEEKVKNM